MADAQLRGKTLCALSATPACRMNVTHGSAVEAVHMGLPSRRISTAEGTMERTSTSSCKAKGCGTCGRKSLKETAPDSASMACSGNDHVGSAAGEVPFFTAGWNVLRIFVGWYYNPLTQTFLSHHKQGGCALRHQLAFKPARSSGKQSGVIQQDIMNANQP